MLMSYMLYKKYVLGSYDIMPYRERLELLTICKRSAFGLVKSQQNLIVYFEDSSFVPRPWTDLTSPVHCSIIKIYVSRPQRTLV